MLKSRSSLSKGSPRPSTGKVGAVSGKGRVKTKALAHAKPKPKPKPKASARYGKVAKGRAYEFGSVELIVRPAVVKIAKQTGALALVHNRDRDVHFGSFGNLNSEERSLAVRKGLPARFLDDAIKAVGVTRADLLAGIGVSSSTAGRVKQNETRFSMEDSERLARLARLWTDVKMVYETNDGTRAWLTGHVPSVGGVPLRVLDTQDGFERAHRSILQLAYGVFA